MAASITIQTLITHGNVVDFTDTKEVSDWLAECYRFADIEDHPELKESAWIGLAKIDNLNARRQYVETCMSQCLAIKDITVVNSTT